MIFVNILYVWILLLKFSCLLNFLINFEQLVNFTDTFFLFWNVEPINDFAPITLFYLYFNIKFFYLFILWFPIFFLFFLYNYWVINVLHLYVNGFACVDATTKYLFWFNFFFKKINFFKKKIKFYQNPYTTDIIDFFARANYSKTSNGLQYFFTEYFFVCWWLIIIVFFFFFITNELLFFIIFFCFFCFFMEIFFLKLKLKIWTDFWKLNFGWYFSAFALSIKDFKNDIFYWNWFYSLILLISLIIFLLSSVLLVLCYIMIFFHSFFLWNGYFFETIIHIGLWHQIKFFTHYGIITNLKFDYYVGLDSLNIWLIWLTSLLTFLCIYFLWDNEAKSVFLLQASWIFFLEFSSFQFFCVCDFIWMYIFFELSLLPIFILIIYGGSTWRKVHAAYQMIFFTFIGSIFLLLGILLLFLKLKTFNYFDIIFILKNSNNYCLYSIFEKKLIWFFFFFGFAIKIPLYPFHIWLPEAHSEAPTVGSVLLAGVLLKMGTYGFLRFLLPLFPEIFFFFKTCVFAMCLSGVILASFAALVQIDIKKIIAYSSIGHMGLIILGLSSNNQFGLLGGCFMMLSHGLIASALFFSIGILYWIYGTRSLIYYSNLAHFMPKFAIFFFFFSLSNMGFPGTASFPAELLIFTSLMEQHVFFITIISFGSLITSTYTIWLLTWLSYGQISSKISIFRDLNLIEKWIFFILSFFILIFGLFPFFLIDFLKLFVSFFLI